jgi:hypothetical protein
MHQAAEISVAENENMNIYYFEALYFSNLVMTLKSRNLRCTRHAARKETEQTHVKCF